MALIACVLCGTTHESSDSRYQTWKPGLTGWACAKWFKPVALHHLTDFAPDDLKEQRIAHAPDMIQRFNKDNELSREFVETYPQQVQGMIDKGVVTKKQVRKSKYVYKKDMKGLEKLPHEGAAQVLGKE